MIKIILNYDNGKRSMNTTEIDANYGAFGY
jgi:hypothetical protein